MRKEAEADISGPDLSEWTILYRPQCGQAPKKPALFLDRDGVLIEDAHYIHDPNDVKLIAGVRETIQRFRSFGFAIVVVTNQSGVARGYFNRDAYMSVERRVHDLLGTDEPDAVYACPFHEDGIAPFNLSHEWRKPRDGMLRAAAVELNIDLHSSLMVGDNISDVEAGLAAGVAGVFHVLTGQGATHRLEVEKLRKTCALLDGAERIVLCVDSIADVFPINKAL